MNVGTFNIRGGGNSTKRRRIAQIITKEKADLCFFQETKLKKLEERVVKSFWGFEECEWSAMESEGHSGGLLTIWRKDAISPGFSFRTKGALGVNAEWKGINCYFVNVYAPCNRVDKRILWRNCWNGSRICH